MSQTKTSSKTYIRFAKFSAAALETSQMTIRLKRTDAMRLRTQAFLKQVSAAKLFHGHGVLVVSYLMCWIPLLGRNDEGALLMACARHIRDHFFNDGVRQ